MESELSHMHPIPLAIEAVNRMGPWSKLRRVSGQVFLGVLAGLVSVSCWSAEPWRPPTAMMLADPNQVLVAVAVEIQPANVVVWKRVEVIQGTPAERFSTPLNSRIPGEVVPGREYVVAITSWRRHALFREGLEMDPEGPRLVEVPGLGPAIFPHLLELKRVLRSVMHEDLEPAEYLIDLRELMRNEWPGVRRLALTELYLRPEVLARADQETVASLRSILADSNPDWAETELILTIGRRLAAPLQEEWLVQESRSVVADAPIHLALASSRPALVETSLEILATRGTTADGGLAIRHLASNNPGVVKAAIAAAAVLDCKAGLVEARLMLARVENLHLESRQALEEFVGRGCHAP